MPRDPFDPARLKGEALNRWYRRTPDEIEAERLAAAEERYTEFFGSPAATEPQVPAVRSQAPDTDMLWIANGRGGYRAIRPGQSDFLSTLDPGAVVTRDNGLPVNSAAIEGGELLEIGNPHNPRLRKEWEAANGRPWPRTADGRAYDVAHIRAIADGGTNTLDNIRPMEPAEHRASHKEDSSRWGKRASIAHAFGGRVEPPAHAPRPRGATVKGFGGLGWLSDITGVLSGRIRTDTPVHFWNDMLGYSSEDDLPREDLIA